MVLRSLSDQALLAATEKLAQDERETLMVVLAHLREIERRRLYCDLGYSSLPAYAVKQLRYSDDQAARRINAMRLIKDLPEVAEKVQSGELSLSNASSAQTLAKRLTMPPEKKRELVKKLANKSTREAEREMAEISPQALRRDSVRAVSEETIEIRFSAPRKLETKLNQLKGLLAHRHPHLTLADLVDKLADLALTEWNPAKPGRSRKNRATLSHGAINASTRREVWRRDQGKCVNCGSRHALEMDHRLPRSCGGSGEVENLSLLCRKCNQRAAIKTLGLKKMAQYFESSCSRPCAAGAPRS